MPSKRVTPSHLKACPFCNTSAVLYRVNAEHQPLVRMRIRCDSEDCVMFEDIGLCEKEVRDRLCKKWNTRRGEEERKPVDWGKVLLSFDERTVLDCLTEKEQHIDHLCKSLQWPVARMSSALGLLELKGYCTRNAGMRFVKTGRATP